MPVIIVGPEVIIGSYNIAAQDFTGLVQRHLARVPRTQPLETDGQQLQTGQSTDDEWKKFVRQIIVWGGGQRFILPHVEKISPSVIRNVLQTAAQRLSAVPPEIGPSLDTVQWLKGLGVSYGSKVLRFLRPDICPVLDSRISEAAVYGNDRSGYLLYAQDASQVARFLERQSVFNPMQRAQCGWFAGDVDMALYTKIQGW